jgi:hypothetical protein
VSEIVCTMPGCQTTAGCLCRNRASMTAWRGQIAKDALILNIANPSFAAGRLAGLREAAAVAADLAGRTDNPCVVADAILALAEGGEG